MKLRKNLLNGIRSNSFEKPSAIQMRAIPAILDGHDTIAQAQSGTGKTATFAIATLQKIDLNFNRCQALILAPTRELAKQIQKVVVALGGYMSVSIHACTGRRHNDYPILFKGVQVVVGTPRIVMSAVYDGALSLDDCKILCLDEADEMMSRGWKDAVLDIFRHLTEKVREKVQCCLFSSTMPSDVLDVTSHLMCNPIKILVKRELLPFKAIKEFQECAK